MKRGIFRKIAVLLTAGAMVMGMSATAFADTASNNDITNNDIIDTSATGSITIHKYDMTAAEEAGVYDSGSAENGTGRTDSDIEGTLSDYAMQGVVFTYLNVGKIEQYSYSSGTSTDVRVVYEIPAELADILGLTADEATDMAADGVSEKCTKSGVYHYTSTQINEALAGIITEGRTAAKNALEEYVTSNGGTNMSETDASGVTSAGSLSLGLYLIVETSVPDNVIETVNPFFVSLPYSESDGSDWFYDVVVYPKNETGEATLDKKAKEATGLLDENGEDTIYIDGTYNDDVENSDDYAGSRDEYEYGDVNTADEGSYLDYIIVTGIPKITSEATYVTQISYVDDLSAGLTYVGDFFVAFYDNAVDANKNNISNAVEVWKESDGYFDVSTSGDYTKGSEMKLDITDAGLAKINPAYSEYYMVVYYQVYVEDSSYVTLGDEGNGNDVTMTWERTNRLYKQTIEDVTEVFTYGIDLTKTFSDGSTDFSDVHFVLYNRSDGFYLTASGGPGTYYINGHTTDESEATQFTPDGNGKIYIDGLEADTYVLTETSTKAGFTLLDDDIVIVITETDTQITPGYAESEGNDSVTDPDVVKGSASATVDGVEASMTEDDGAVIITIENNKGFATPLTGGAGTYAVVIIGAAIVCIAIVATRKKKTA